MDELHIVSFSFRIFFLSSSLPSLQFFIYFSFHPSFVFFFIYARLFIYVCQPSSFCEQAAEENIWTEEG
jgi:hypothetical protein